MNLSYVISSIVLMLRKIIIYYLLKHTQESV